MAESFFRSNILSKAWVTVWRHKTLWFFGLFAAILSFGEEYDILVRNSNILDAIPQRMEEYRAIAAQGLLLGFWNKFLTLVKTNVPATLNIIFAWTIAVLALAWLVIVSQAALIEGARRHFEGKSLHILEGFDTGMAYFWQIFRLNVIAKIVVYGSFLAVSGPLFVWYLQTGSTLAIILTMLWTFVVFFPGITIIAFITKFASAYIVIKKYNVREAIGAGWALFTRHWLVSLELALILILINFVVVYAAVSTMVNALGYPNFTTLEFLIFILLLGFLFAWLTTFQFSCWVYLFFHLEEDAAPSKLRRIIHYILDIREKPSRAALARARR